MPLCYQSSQWADSVWRSHVKRYRTAHHTLQDGERKQPGFTDFSDDVHARLYLHHEPPQLDDAPEWATNLHQQAEDIPEWAQLKARCRSNAFVSGIATETLLRALVPQMEETDEPDDAQNGDNRRALRKAIRQATHDVDDAQQAVEALQASIGAGHGIGYEKPETLQDLETIRNAYDLIKDSPSLKTIMDLAGRLKRLARSQKRTKVTPGVGHIKGITTGGDLSKILPSQLAGLRSNNRLLRLDTLNRILSKRALQYLTEGKQPVGRGPIIVCMDESGSMFGRGGTPRPHEWAKAVALAMLTTATEQRRDWHLIGFNDSITHQETILAGKATLENVVNAIAHEPTGGTNFDYPLNMALSLIESSEHMNRADVVFITDGIARISASTIQRYQKALADNGLTVYAILIGEDADTEIFKPLTKEIYTVQHFDKDDNASIAPVILAQ